MGLNDREVDGIPLYMVLDALSQASHNVSILMHMQLDIPPVKKDTVRVQGDDSYTGDTEQQMAVDSTPVSIVKVYEIWEVLLDETEYDLDKVYVVLGAKYKANGYAGGKWSDVEYMGFYTTVEEAQNEINGYLS